MIQTGRYRKAAAFLLRAGLPITAAAGLSACGPSQASAPAACPASALTITVDHGAAGAAAGTQVFPLDFTNTSSADCALSGYPAVSFTTGPGGTEVGSPGAPDPTAEAGRILLSPGGSAHAWLHLATAANYPAAECGPVTAAGISVRLPGETSGTFIASPEPTCSKVIPGSQVLTIEPFQSGLARRGTA